MDAPHSLLIFCFSHTILSFFANNLFFWHLFLSVWTFQSVTLIISSVIEARILRTLYKLYFDYYIIMIIILLLYGF